MPDKNVIDLIAATHNEGKLKEFRHIAEGSRLVIRGLDAELVKAAAEETGHSFDENALQKARAVHVLTGGWVMADDSGLCVDALEGRPGIRTARYAGEDARDEDNVRRLLEEMEEVPPGQRGAAFCCSLAIISPGGEEKIYQGITRGEITRERKGRGGFGYDPVFMPSGHDRTMAQMTAEEKNRLSHRGRAFRMFLEELGR